MLRGALLDLPNRAFILTRGTIILPLIILILTVFAFQYFRTRPTPSTVVTCTEAAETSAEDGYQDMPDSDYLERRILELYSWALYKAVPAVYKASAEVTVLMDFLRDFYKTSPEDLPLYYIQSKTLLESEDFRALFLECWERGSFRQLRNHVVMQPALVRVPATSSESDRPLASELFQQPIVEPLDGGEMGMQNNSSARDEGTHVRPLGVGISGGNYLSIENSVLGSKAQNIRINQVCYIGDEDAKISDWLSPKNYRITHDDILRRRAENTGNWFIMQPAVQEWLSPSGPQILWSPGIPGVGKTVMASVVIDHLQRTQARSAPVLFVYFSYKSGNNQSLSAVIESLSRQMHEACCNANVPSPFRALYASHKDGSKPSKTELQIQLTNAFKQFQQSWIVIDALDEYLEHYNDTAIELLLDTVSTLADNFKLFITSRVIGAMPRIFDRLGAARQEIEANGDDITSYLQQRINAGNLHFEVTEKFAQEIVEGILHASRGRFLMAELHMNALRNCLNPGELKEALRSLPDQVDEIYVRIMMRIDGYPPNERNLALNALMWITCSIRPLLVSELPYALAVQPGRLDVEDFITPISTITSLCAGLVIVENGHVMFVHLTAQDHFFRLKDQYFTASDQMMANTCIEYLFTPSIYETVRHLLDLSMVDWSSDHGGTTFYDYASLHWATHLFKAGHITAPVIITALRSGDQVAVDTCTRYIGFALNWMFFNGAPDNVCIKDCPIFLAVYTRQPSMLTTLLDQVNELPLTYAGRSPLEIAGRFQEVEAVQILLDWCAQRITHASQTDSRSATTASQSWLPACNDPILLFLVVGYKHTSLLETLSRQEGFDVNLRDEAGFTLLMSAAAHGNDAVINQLLSHASIDINAQSYGGSTAIFQAAFWGHESAIKLLLQQGNIEVNLPDSEGNTALMCAAERGHDGVIDLLLDYGVDVNACNRNGRTALHGAIEGDHTTSVGRLLKRSPSIDTNATDTHGTTPLLLAAEHNQYSILQTLFELRGPSVDVNAQDNDGDTALSCAVIKGYHRIVKLLLEQPTLDINKQDYEGRTPLSWAASSCNMGRWDDQESKTEPTAYAAVRLLLGHRRVDVNLADNEDRTPLDYARETGFTSVMELLQANVGL